MTLAAVIPPVTFTAHPTILSVGGYRPRRVVGNDEVCRAIESSDEWIQRRSGIVTRHWADPDETLLMMASSASRHALSTAGISANDISCVIVATFTHLVQTPALAPQVAAEVGALGAAGFDVSAGCAGFTHALALAANMIRSGSTPVLVVGAERMSDLVDLEDQATAFLFGDGAGAVLVGASSEPGIGPVVWGADGTKSHLISQTVPWDRLKSEPGLRWPALTQTGQAVYRWAVGEMSRVGQQALDVSGLRAEDIDVFVPHQANLRIIEALAGRLQLRADCVVARDVITAGNTSGASIPLAMQQVLTSGQARSGDIALLIGYGAGLSYAAVVARLP